ncbi:hypothetical protein CCMA1212_005600 [Trichoderma ghanense]|uniref:Uncharacterized protein n=1 Tax=Trichoderma ghanense TaxID=65468 RepID=A0ABY2H5G3_9HYPO
MTNDSGPQLLPKRRPTSTSLSSIRRQADEQICRFGPTQSSTDASQSILSNEVRRLGVTAITHPPPPALLSSLLGWETMPWPLLGIDHEDGLDLPKWGEEKGGVRAGFVKSKTDRGTNQSASVNQQQPRTPSHSFQGRVDKGNRREKEAVHKGTRPGVSREGANTNDEGLCDTPSSCGIAETFERRQVAAAKMELPAGFAARDPARGLGIYEQRQRWAHSSGSRLCVCKSTLCSMPA